MFYFERFYGHNVLKSDFLSGVNHFFTTKELILKTKETPELEAANRELIINKLGLNALLSPEQRHTTNVAFIENNKDFYPKTDGLIMSLENSKTGFFLNFADCTPIILYDKKLNLISIVHSGWRGTVGKILQNALFEMKSDTNDVVAVIGPCICFKCFETSEEIMELLIETVSNPTGCYKKTGEKCFADLKEINKRQLLDLGVKNIDVAPFCTCCNNDKFFSYRKENKTSNRMSAFVWAN